MNNYLEKRIQKLSIDKDEIQLKMDLYSTIIPFLLSTEKFKRNIEIREFTKQLNLKKEMKDYLFVSRTQVVARIIREIENFNEVQLKENVQIFKKYNTSEYEYESKKVLQQNTLRQKKVEEKILKMMDKYTRNKNEYDD